MANGRKLKTGEVLTEKEFWDHVLSLVHADERGDRDPDEVMRIAMEISADPDEETKRRALEKLQLEELKKSFRSRQIPSATERKGSIWHPKLNFGHPLPEYPDRFHVVQYKESGRQSTFKDGEALPHQLDAVAIKGEAEIVRDQENLDIKEQHVATDRWRANWSKAYVDNEMNRTGREYKDFTWTTVAKETGLKNAPSPPPEEPEGRFSDGVPPHDPVTGEVFEPAE